MLFVTNPALGIYIEMFIIYENIKKVVNWSHIILGSNNGVVRGIFPIFSVLDTTLDTIVCNEWKKINRKVTL